MKLKIVKLVLAGALALAAFQPAARPAAGAPALQTDPPQEIILNDAYRVTFDGVEYHADGTSTWRYSLAELPGARSIAYWVLEIPPCAPVLDAGPGAWDLARPNPLADLAGVKWTPPGSFVSGQFWVRLETSGAVGLTRVLVKSGPTAPTGEMAGPTCTGSEPPGGTDSEPPTIEWLAPVSRGERYDMAEGESVELLVAAGDNVGVDRVAFLRWDDADQDYVTLAVDTSAPFAATVSAADLLPGYNFITAGSADAAGNISEWHGIWLYLQTGGDAPGASMTIYLPLALH